MEITSISGFMEKCFGNPLLKKEDITVFYRGVNEIFPREIRHIPSLYYPPDKFYEYEDIIFKEAVSVFPNELLAQHLTVEKLFIMQHYNLPTRILDISKNPLVSLFFACFADKGRQVSLSKDGVVYVYAVPTKAIKFSDSDTVSILANLCKRPNTFSVKNFLHLDRESFNTVEDVEYLVSEIHAEKPQFYPLIQPKDINSVVCLRPRMNNPRIIRQDGYFFLFGIGGEKKDCAQMPQEWIKDPIVIPSKYKESILGELDKMDFNEGFFYPDFEHVNEVIRRRYGKK